MTRREIVQNEIARIENLVKEFSVRGIIEAKSPEPGGGCNLERRPMRRAID